MKPRRLQRATILSMVTVVGHGPSLAATSKSPRRIYRGHIRRAPTVTLAPRAGTEASMMSDVRALARSATSAAWLVWHAVRVSLARRPRAAAPPIGSG